MTTCQRVSKIWLIWIILKYKSIAQWVNRIDPIIWVPNITILASQIAKVLKIFTAVIAVLRGKTRLKIVLASKRIKTVITEVIPVHAILVVDTVWKRFLCLIFAMVADSNGSNREWSPISYFSEYRNYFRWNFLIHTHPSLTLNQLLISLYSSL